MDFLTCTSNSKPKLHNLGIYPIVNRANDLLPLFKLGITTAQIRIKDLTGKNLINELTQANFFAKLFNARLFINDYWSIAIKIKAYGVHLGQEDLDCANLIKIHNAGLRLGVSTNSLTEITKITQVFKINPSYIAIGAIFSTQSKKLTTPTVGLKNLTNWVQQIKCPVVAIGGINTLNIKQVVACGVSGVAMINAIKITDKSFSKSIQTLQQGFIQKTPVILTIAGSDPYGGAGIQVDIKTIHALNGYALSVPTALTSQNSQGVASSFTPCAKVFKSQLTTLLTDIKIDAIKIGMLPSVAVVQELIKILKKHQFKIIVYDPVIISSSGYKLIDNDAIELIKQQLLPLISLLTPNIPEANLLTNKKDNDDIAHTFYSMGLKNILIKGGHNKDCDYAIDYLYQQNLPVESFKQAWIKTSHTHGTGCVLSSAITTLLSQQVNLVNAIDEAKMFLTDKLNQSNDLKIHYKNQLTARKEPITLIPR